MRMPKIAVATDDGSNLGETMDNPMAFIVYEVTDKEVLSAHIKYYDENVMEVIGECSAAIARCCSDQLKSTMASKGISAVISDLAMPDPAVAKYLNIDSEAIGGTNYECKH